MTRAQASSGLSGRSGWRRWSPGRGWRQWSAPCRRGWRRRQARRACLAVVRGSRRTARTWAGGRLGLGQGGGSDLGGRAARTWAGGRLGLGRDGGLGRRLGMAAHDGCWLTSTNSVAGRQGWMGLVSGKQIMGECGSGCVRRVLLCPLGPLCPDLHAELHMRPRLVCAPP